MQNSLKSNEWQWIWVHKTFKIQIQKWRPNNSDFLKNLFLREIRPPLFNLQKLQDSEKSTLESCRMHWNLMNDKKFGSIKLFKLKYKRGDQKTHTFCKIASTQILGPHSLISRNFKTLRKVLLHHSERIRI